MSKRLDENLGSVGYDGLIVANEPVVTHRYLSDFSA